MEGLAPDQEAELEESRPDVVEQNAMTLSEAVRLFLDFVADEAVRQVMTGATDPAVGGPRDSTEGDVPGGPHERRPRR